MVMMSCWLPSLSQSELINNLVVGQSDLTEGGVGHTLQRLLAVLGHRLGGHLHGLHQVDGERHPGWCECSSAVRGLVVFVQALVLCLLCVLTLRCLLLISHCIVCYLRDKRD